jgi:nucleoside 2-deoxyribosyltransferase
MKIAYFGISKSNRVNFDKEINQLKKCLAKHSIELLVFVDKYEFTPDQEKEIMTIAFKEIDNSNFLIVEVSKKAIGIGIEVGYAFAKRKPIIYIKRKNTKHSTTIGGCSDYIIEYENEFYLSDEVEKIIKTDSLFHFDFAQ